MELHNGLICVPGIIKIRAGLIEFPFVGSSENDAHGTTNHELIVFGNGLETVRGFNGNCEYLIIG